MIDTVLFDLDGTLVDTAPDMANALIQLLNEEERPPLDYENIRPIVSNGSIALVQLGFPDIEDKHYLEYLKQRYLEIYQEKLFVDSCLFDGMESLLTFLENNQMKWGVVTNKPGWLTEPLLEQMGLDKRCSCIVSGDTTANRKPHPEPMFYACKLSNSQPENCIYVGDAERDIAAGKNAGMQTVAALYGYIAKQDKPSSWLADYSIQQPNELIEILDTEKC